MLVVSFWVSIWNAIGLRHRICDWWYHIWIETGESSEDWLSTITIVRLHGKRSLFQSVWFFRKFQHSKLFEIDRGEYKFLRTKFAWVVLLQQITNESGALLFCLGLSDSFDLSLLCMGRKVGLSLSVSCGQLRVYFWGDRQTSFVDTCQNIGATG